MNPTPETALVHHHGTFAEEDSSSRSSSLVPSSHHGVGGPVSEFIGLWTDNTVAKNHVQQLKLDVILQQGVQNNTSMENLFLDLDDNSLAVLRNLKPNISTLVKTALRFYVPEKWNTPAPFFYHNGIVYIVPELLYEVAYHIATDNVRMCLSLEDIKVSIQHLFQCRCEIYKQGGDVKKALNVLGLRKKTRYLVAKVPAPLFESKWRDFPTKTGVQRMVEWSGDINNVFLQFKKLKDPVKSDFFTANPEFSIKVPEVVINANASVRVSDEHPPPNDVTDKVSANESRSPAETPVEITQQKVLDAVSEVGRMAESICSQLSEGDADPQQIESSSSSQTPANDAPPEEEEDSDSSDEEDSDDSDENVGDEFTFQEGDSD